MDRGRSSNSYDSLWGGKARDNPIVSQLPLQYRIRSALTQEQQTAYQVMYRIQEITIKLRTNDLNPPTSRYRSLSPPPVYDSQGKRTNTREHRYRKKLEEERHRLVEIALKMIPHFIAPDDYRRPSKFQDKYYIPINDYPEINFVGLLLGPRGNTLKQLQQQSGCKIVIRGRGSVKEGKAATDLPKGAMNMNEPLHCVISADTEEKIPLGINAVESIIIKAITSPEGQNDLKRGQLRELAVLNGTLREDNRPCPLCGEQGHKKWECSSNPSLSMTVICQRCNQPGHAARDCTSPLNEFGKRTSDGPEFRETKKLQQDAPPPSGPVGSHPSAPGSGSANSGVAPASLHPPGTMAPPGALPPPGSLAAPGTLPPPAALPAPAAPGTLPPPVALPAPATLPQAGVPPAPDASPAVKTAVPIEGPPAPPQTAPPLRQTAATASSAGSSQSAQEEPENARNGVEKAAPGPPAAVLPPPPPPQPPPPPPPSS